MMILATDLDGTFLGGSHDDQLQLYRHINEREDIRLIFVTGRGMESVWSLLHEPFIPNPDYIICDVGATVLNGSTLKPIQPLQSEIAGKWPGAWAVRRQLEGIQGLKYQPVGQEHRCSFFYDSTVSWAQVRTAVAATGCDMIISGGKYVDVLPKGVHKGATLKALIRQLQWPGERVLVAGDTMNDASLYETGYRGIVVGGAEDELVKATGGNTSVFQAKSAGAGGILEGMRHWGMAAALSEYYPANSVPFAGAGKDQ